MANHYGWSGKMLEVDLTTGLLRILDTGAWLPDYIGGVGVAAALAWQRLRPGMDAFDPDNPLMIMTGPLTGTLASGAGRVEVCGVAPQQNPSIYSRSGMGGHWGAELKYAGWDGVIVTGVSPTPVYLLIENDTVVLHPADGLWGQGVYGTTRSLRSKHGARSRVVAIGPAGERRSRIAALLTETGNAAGQGGYGGLMGAKRLKAIVVRGTGGVRLAYPRAFMDVCLSASREGFTPTQRQLNPLGTPGSRQRKCGFCMSPCAHPLVMNQALRPGESTGNVALHCYRFDTQTPHDDSPRMLATDLGLNGWEVSYGIIPWLQMCKQEGLIQSIDGLDIPAPAAPLIYQRDTEPVTTDFVHMLMRKIASREDALGDALAEGTCRAAELLFDGQGAPLLDRIYPRRAGQTSHWAGHWGPGGTVKFPNWLVPVLQWCVDTRDPASDSTHSFTTHAQHYLAKDGPLPASKVAAVARKIYGVEGVGDPAVSYQLPGSKAAPALWHHLRGMLVDSLILCDYEHARVFSMLSDDGQADTGLMAKLLAAATGEHVTEATLDQASARIWTLQRAIDVHYFGRSRGTDEATLDAYRLPGKDDGVVLDRTAFLPLLTDYYRRAGWDAVSGWPTCSSLEALGLDDVATRLYCAD